MHSTLKPNFFIVGAPKCGTTAMASYLTRNPEVFFSKPKEPHFFGSDIRPPYHGYIRDEGAYLNLFRGAGYAKAIGEGSVFYLYSKRAAMEIKNFNSNAKIVIMLRNPIDAMQSLFAHRVYNGNEDLLNLMDAINLQSERKNGNELPNSLTQTADGLMYTDIYDYYDQIKRYFEVFGRQNCHVIYYDDFSKRTDEAYYKLSEFLNISYKPLSEYPVVNGSKAAKNIEVLRWIRSARELPLYKTLLEMTPSGVRTRFKSYLVSKIPNSKLKLLTDEQKGVIRARLAVNRDKLSELLNRDLSGWYAEDQADSMARQLEAGNANVVNSEGSDAR